MSDRPKAPRHSQPRLWRAAATLAGAAVGTLMATPGLGASPLRSMRALMTGVGEIKQAIKLVLEEQFDITHSTLEFEREDQAHQNATL